jgi:virginiamycin B lyase
MRWLRLRVGLVIALTVASALPASAGATQLGAGQSVEYRTAIGSAPAELVLSPDGNSVSFTEPGTGTLAHVTDKGRYQREYLAHRNTGPEALAMAPDRSIWFTETTAGRIGRVAGGRVTSFRLATGSGPRGTAVGADGNMWFTESGNDRIGRITPAGGVRAFPIPTPRADPLGIAAGPDGALWFTEPAVDRIGRITLGGRVSEFRVPGAAAPFGITAGPDGRMWFTLPSRNAIGAVTMTGAMSVYPIPTGGSRPRGIAAATDGALWFTQPGSNQIGRIATDGSITETAVPTPHAGPFGITTGLRGQIWYSERSADKVAELGVTAPRTQYVSVGTSGFVQQSPPRALPGTTVQWTFFGPSTESVTDATGMGLFGSGPHSFVSTFSYTFTAAGDYPYRSTTTGATATYKILPAAPRHTSIGTPFTVRWASRTPDAGFAYDVRYRAPGASSWTTWQTQTTVASASFTPTVAGTYTFEARLVDTNTMQLSMSLWSPSATTAVS